MANTFVDLFPSMYAALDTVSREMVGFVPAVRKDATEAERAAVGQTVYFPKVPRLTAGNISAGATGPAPNDVAIGNDSLTISKSRGCNFYLEGEQARGLGTGPGVNPVVRDLFTQAFRTLVNEIETDLAALYTRASRAVGVASGHVFDSTDGIATIAQVRKMLAQNGAPMADLHLVVDPVYAAALRENTALTKANEAGSDEMLRLGTLGRLLGFDLHESGGITLGGSAAAASYVVGAAGALAGAVSVPVITGSAAIAAGDLVVFQNDPEKYVVNTALTGPGNLLINAPGLRSPTVSARTLTFQGTYTPLFAFHRDAIVLVNRLPALPDGGDSGQHTTVKDPHSGLVFDVAEYRQYRRVAYEVSLAWGVKAAKSEHFCLIQGT